MKHMHLKVHEAWVGCGQTGTGVRTQDQGSPQHLQRGDIKHILEWKSSCKEQGKSKSRKAIGARHCAVYNVTSSGKEGVSSDLYF